jgi:hypothetical protein
MRPDFGAVATALHGAPAAVVGAGVVVEDEPAVIRGAATDAGEGVLRKDLHRLPSHGRKRLPRAGSGPASLATAAGQCRGNIRGSGKEVNHVDIQWVEGSTGRG